MMKTLYVECKMGVAGDMLSAALLELCDDRDEILKELSELGIPGVTFELTKNEKCGIMGSHLEVKVNGEEEVSEDVEHEHSHEHEHHHGHHHTHLKDIEEIVNSLKMDDAVKQDVINVYKLIAEAESSVHGVNVNEIHFHEVGNMDAIADISAVCLVMSRLNVDNIVVSPIHVGSGQVKCAHGILPVPAPATAYLLRGIPSYSGDIKGELCTPTGAALVKYFASSFGNQPVMSISKIGYGMGKKDFPQANTVRVMLGEDTDMMDSVTELICNLDDMTPEEIGFATERLMEEGALDVFTTSIGMKKNRPGVMLTVLCRDNAKDEFVKLIFKYTTTIGIRESICRRYVLDRVEKTITTPDGDIRVKEVSGYGVSRQKKEYEDLARIAREKDSGIIERK
ncbi:nickel pincer cofactor biosynthesis protein LarC [Butyrivibrio sp. WCD3002]|uniref:nickel pincer cofactor biosynthesis protein LarC n=1 Tax=Butyrivibrio sp. WCD3002 TaxID=1280676 RepID=UPI0003FA6649|nr:nickel pincer cofactor biosynthesis protein LarC [Butyrivibrio sp. WCD3002]